MRKPCICVIGRWRDETKEVLAMSEEVGKLIGYRGAILVSGGGPGVMEFASKGAQENGGFTLGFLAGQTIEPEANQYLDIAIPTGTGYEIRSSLAIRMSNVVIMIGGGNGSLGELSIAYLHNKPIVLLKGTGGWADKIPPVLVEGKFLDERKNVEINFASTPKECVDLAFALIEQPIT